MIEVTVAHSRVVVTVGKAPPSATRQDAKVCGQ
jgi:hypothetical protein